MEFVLFLMLSSSLFSESAPTDDIAPGRGATDCVTPCDCVLAMIPCSSWVRFPIPPEETAPGADADTPPPRAFILAVMSCSS